MAFDPNLFIVNISPQPANIVLGKTGTVTVTASNNNPADWGYNLTLTMTIPDGVSFDSSSVPPTSQVLNLDSTITLTWLNITDLAPNQTGFTFPVTLMVDETFRALPNLDVPFDIPLTPVALSATVDTKPRGFGEPGNIQYTKNDSTSVVPARYIINKIVPGKYPKGAGIPLGVGPQWPFTHQINIDNNTRQASLVDITDNMDNGIRFIGPITAVGPDSIQLSPPNPVVVTPIPAGQDFVSITWNNINLSAGAVDVVSYDVAFWDNYTVGGIENSGTRILHQTPLNNVVTMTGASGPVASQGTTLAMDLTIDKSQNPTSADVGININYTLAYKVNQYDSLNSVVATDVISDGQTFVVGVPPPTSVSIKNPLTGETTVIWDLGALLSSSSGSITFSTVVDAFYTAPPLNRPVVAGDPLSDLVNIDGINDNFGTLTPDSSASSALITIPSITKLLLNIYYKDGTLKPVGITAVAPGDMVEFSINYIANFSADQKDVFIDDFFPLALSAAGISNIVYNPFLPTTGPLPTGNNGVEWFLAPFVPAQTFWNVDFRVPMANVNFLGTENNLAKLEIKNTGDIVFSARDQVPVDFGEPNMILTKTVLGPTPNAILPGQSYTYTAVIKNPQNIDNTVVDAFDLDFSDVLPNFLTFTPGTLIATATGGTPVFNPPVFTPLNLIDMHITRLKPDDEITVTYSVTVDPGIGPGLSLTNQAHTTSPYSQPFDPIGDNYQYPGLERDADVTLTSSGAPLTKTVDFNVRVVGDKVNYTISWTVPAGLIAYNVVVTDILPIGQSYDDNASPLPSSVIGQVITWPTIPSVDATGGAVTLVYSFRANIDSSISIIPPYTEIQTNTGRVNWNSDPGGLEPMQEDGTVDVLVENPHVLLTKGVRNVSNGEATFGNSTTAIGNDVIEYSLIANNNGSADAYLIQIVDQLGGLDSGTTFIGGSIFTPLGTTASYDGVNNLVNWNIPLLVVGNSLQLLFRVRVKTGFLPGTNLFNTGTTNSYSNVNLTFLYPPENSNTVNILLQAGVRGISLSNLMDTENIIIEEFDNAAVIKNGL
ncbi:DUF11 domain-containing protein [Clostridium lacusfryxellense]|uniref:DUF11 domain-containing protein n=1 Tax=Clostridium lacusfryxellense TaxID=205328 RepID=UPI001C0E7FF9|nr:DUF11 domain-containing protein [Clostridium lacusfryxellense]MBU3114607.1 DUF11 domain-containing protein [Clostridium lacusfryxellense]